MPKTDNHITGFWITPGPELSPAPFMPDAGAEKCCFPRAKQNTTRGWATRAIGLMRLLAYLVVTGGAATVRVKAVDTNVEAFKQFLSKPACISRMVYTEERNCDDKMIRTNIAAYCDGNFYLREIVALDNPDLPISTSNRMRSALFAGKSNDLRWQINGFGVGKAISPPTGSPDPYTAFSETLAVIVGGVINFGPQEIQPGSFTWRGDEFEAAENRAFRQSASGRRFSGKIVVVGGMVAQLNLGPVKSFHYEYDATPDKPIWFPHGITMSVQGKCTKRWTFYQVVMGDPFETAPLFNPDYHIAPEVRLITLISNGQIIAKPDGRSPDVVALVKRELPSVSHGGDKAKSSMQVRVALALAVCLPLCFLAWYIVAKKPPST